MLTFALKADFFANVWRAEMMAVCADAYTWIPSSVQCIECTFEVRGEKCNVGVC